MKKTLLTILFCTFGAWQFVTAQVSEKEAMARQWIKSNFKELKINSDSDINLRFVRNSISGETLRFQQMVNNIPVFDTEIVIHFDLNGQVSYSDHNITKDVVQINTIPQITRENAITIADKEIGVFATGGNPLEVDQAAEPVRGEKGFQLGPSQGGEHRHG